MQAELSAGGVVVDDAGRCVVIVPTRRAADGSRVLALPKGHPEAGESLEQAALREVREEAGVDTRVVESLGRTHYVYQRRGRAIAKEVAFFLLHFVSGDVADHDHEVLEARWVPLPEAVRTLSFPGERDMAARALSRHRASE